MAAAARQEAHDAFTRIGYPNNGADKLIDDEGLSDITHLATLDLERAKSIVKTLKSPGGRGAGIAISTRATYNLAFAAHLAKMWKRTQRPNGMTDINVGDTLEDARIQMELEFKHRNDSSIFKPFTNNELKDRNFLELRTSTRKKVCQIRHSCGIQIGFVLRNLLIPKAHADDPALD